MINTNGQRRNGTNVCYPSKHPPLPGKAENKTMNILYKPEGPAKEYADDPIKRDEGWASKT